MIVKDFIGLFFLTLTKSDCKTVPCESFSSYCLIDRTPGQEARTKLYNQILPRLKELKQTELSVLCRRQVYSQTHIFTHVLKVKNGKTCMLI